MNIQVRVLSSRARTEIRALEAEIARLRKGTSAAGTAIGGMTGGSRGIQSLSKWGNQVQWAGRQLQYNFTLPIVLAGAAATKFQLDNERAMTRVIKVYGDGSEAMNKLAQKEIPALGRAFEALSNRFGVAQAETINIAADWAAAGASGLALAKSVKLTMETMILGELEAAEATQALIAIQAQYGQSVDELSKTIDILNMTENQTGISMAGLVQGMSRAAGVARSAGIDVEHLAAMLAALTPAAGSAANAGNALKTMISRVLSPTKEAAEVMGLMGVNTDELGWKSLNGAQRLEVLAEEFQHLDDAQKAVVSSVVASRWQINRFDVLMRDIINTNGYYQKSLNATADATANYKQKVKELNAVLESNPQKAKQIWVILQNALANVIQPILPAMIGLAAQVAKLAMSFSNLDPMVQKIVLGLMLFLAAIGPIARYVGSVANLIGLMKEATIWASGFAKSMLMLALTPFRAIATGLGAIFGPFAAAGGAAMKGLASIWAMGWAKIVVITKAANTAIVVSMATGYTGMRGIWQAILAGAGVFVGKLSTIYALGGKALLFLAPTKILGNLKGMFSALGASIVGVLTKIGPFLLRALTSWVGIAVAAALGIFYNFRDDLGKLWQNIIKSFGDTSSGIGKIFSPVVDFFRNAIEKIQEAFWSLPKGIRDAMMAVFNVVKKAALAVYDMLSYLNPFARHSPSLVESVQGGMEVIRREYASAADIGGIFAKAARDLAAFKSVSSSIGADEWSKEREQVVESYGSMVPLFDALVSDLRALNGVLAQQRAAIQAQEAVVNQWKAALDAANAAIDAQNEKLDVLQARLTALNDQYDAHEEALRTYASAPLAGMHAMEDAIFANEQAQKRLRLEMLRWEEVNGSIQDARDQMAALRGEIEMLESTAAELRSAGAGSDILGPIEDQIDQMEKQYRALEQGAANNPMTQMQEQMEELQRQAEILDLERSLNFDGALREIDQLANGMEELTFEQIVAGIKREQAAMDALEPQIAAVNKAIVDQEAAIKQATAARDAIQARYDAEQAKLQQLNDAYQRTETAIRDIESALRDMASASSEALQKTKELADKVLTPGGQNFLDAAGGNFPDVGGMAPIGREGGLEDQSAMIDEFTAGIVKDIEAGFGSFDVFEPIKKWWKKAWAWITENVGPVLTGVKEAVAAGWNWTVDAFDGSGLQAAFGHVWDTIVDIATTAWDWITDIVKLFAPDIKKIFQALIDAGKQIWNEIGPELAKFKNILEPLGKLFKLLWQVIKPIVALVGGALLLAIKIISSVLANVLGPVLEAVIDIVENVIQVFRGLIEFVLGVLVGDWKSAWEGIKDIFLGTFGAIAGLVEGIVGTIVGIVKGLVEGIVGFFQWLWDILVGNSIIPDLINAIIDWFKSLPGKVIAFVKSLVDAVVKWFGDMWNRIYKLMSPIIGFFKGVVNGVKIAWEWLYTNLKNIWGWIKTNVIDKFIAAVKWWRDRVVAARDGVISAWSVLKDKLYGIYTWIKTNAIDPLVKAFQKVWNKAAEIRDGVANAFTTMKDSIGRIFGKIWDAMKSPLKTVLKFINDYMIGPINTVTSKFGLEIPDISLKFHEGGMVPGSGEKIAKVMGGEGVLTAQGVQAIGGQKALEAANQGKLDGKGGGIGGPIDWLMDNILSPIGGQILDWAKQGVGFALGKTMDFVIPGVAKLIQGPAFVEDTIIGSMKSLRNFMMSWGKSQDEAQERAGKSTGTVSLEGWTRPIGAGYRIGRGSAAHGYPSQDLPAPTGTPIYAAADGIISKAVDWAISYGKHMRVDHGNGVSTLMAHMSKRRYNKGRRVNVGEVIGWVGSTGNSTGPHLHLETWLGNARVDPFGFFRKRGVTFHNGGLVPGYGEQAATVLGGERVLSREQNAIFNSIAGALDALHRVTIAANRAVPVAQYRMAERQRAVGATVRGGTAGDGQPKELHFHGDLTFPNVKSGADAKKFIENLEALGG